MSKLIGKWYQLKDYPDYSINLKGEVYNSKAEIFLKPYRSNGYYRYELKLGVGARRRMSRHRLLALTFLKKPKDFDKVTYHVNHKNGIRGDDRLENLEWVTPKGNALHAVHYGLQSSEPKPFEVRDIVSGNILKFKSLREGVRYFDVTKQTIVYYLTESDGDKAFYVDGKYCQFKYLNSISIWVTEDIPRGSINKPNMYYLKWSNSSEKMKIFGFTSLRNYVNVTKNKLHSKLNKNKKAIFKMSNGLTLTVVRKLQHL